MWSVPSSSRWVVEVEEDDALVVECGDDCVLSPPGCRSRRPVRRADSDDVRAVLCNWVRRRRRADFLADLCKRSSAGVPPRRRAGSRPGDISPEFQAALAAEVERLAGLGDSQVVVRAVNDFFAQLDFELEAVADVRQDAVRQLRQQGWTLERIAEATGLSVSRGGQISRRGGRGGHVRRFAILRD
jgi:hypothetical protein